MSINSYTKWKKYKKHEGPLIRGTFPFKFRADFSNWERILYVVAACEGKYDTVVGYDNTGITFGFLQWTFTSGRLQHLLYDLQRTGYQDHTRNDNSAESSRSLFDVYFKTASTHHVFENYGFRIRAGEIYYGDGYRTHADPKKDKQLIADLCSGKYVLGYNDKEMHSELAQFFNKAGRDPGVQYIQREFAITEFRNAMKQHWKVLGDKFGSIADLIEAPCDTEYKKQLIWSESCIPAIFFNLFQNSPVNAMKLFMDWAGECETVPISIKEAESLIWDMLLDTSLSHWGLNSVRYLNSNKTKKPRCFRMLPALKRAYNVQFKIVE